MTIGCAFSQVARSVRKVASVFLGALALAACSAEYGDPGPSFGAFEYAMRTYATTTNVVVVVVDDRALAGATLLRTNLAAAARGFAQDRLDRLGVGSSDAALWHPIDVRFVLVPASSTSIDDVVHPGSDRALAWISNQALDEGANTRVREKWRRTSTTPFRSK